MGNRVHHVLVAAALLLGSAEAGHAASAVAWSSGFTYAYCSGQATEREAAACAVQRCAERTKQTCRVGVSCAGGGHGAVVRRIYPVGEVVGIGAACGAASASAAANAATAACNKATRPGRCEPPAARWQD
jgi:hypothetical protein